MAFPLIGATTETGTIVFKTFVEESPLNTGIRVTHDTEDISTVFDEKFFEARTGDYTANVVFTITT